jgi:hypothetical protein
MKFSNYQGLLLAGMAVFQVLPAAAQSHGVVMISDLTGVALLEGRKQPLALMDEVAPNLAVTLKAGAKLTFVNMRTGAETTFTGPGKVKLDVLGEPSGIAPGRRRLVAALQGAVHLRPGGLAQASVVMRDVTRPEATGMSPEGPWSLSPTPEFHWKPSGAKASYHFKLQDPQGQVLFELTQDECSVQVPEHLALSEDTAYTWVLDIKLADGGQDRKSGQIKVVPKALREQLQGTRPAQDAPFSERLVYAALLEQHELHEEARPFWRSLAKDRPGDEALAKFAAR